MTSEPKTAIGWRCLDCKAGMARTKSTIMQAQQTVYGHANKTGHTVKLLMTVRGVAKG